MPAVPSAWRFEASGCRMVDKALKVTITNIGPVRSAELELKPVRIIVGPNNSGKSIAMTVVYALLNRMPVSTYAYARSVTRSVLAEQLGEAGHQAIFELISGPKPSLDALPEGIRSALESALR